MSCLDENLVDQLVDGRLGEGERRLVEAHLTSCSACRVWVSEVMRAPAVVASDTLNVEAPQPQRTMTFVGVGSSGARARHFAIGECLADRYRVVRFLAEGGMGEVYDAEDLELRRRVALKTVRAEIASDRRVIDRFRREISLAHKVTHPNVCRIFDLGFHQRGGERVTFLTMEFLDGETLRDRIVRTGGLSTPEALPLIQQMVAGLAAAHAVGVIHRDFKSQNVMLVPGEDGLRAVVSDFGLADSSKPEDASASDGSGIIGSPAYMAPEQVEGRKVDARADLYALGVVMFEMVTGRLPFAAETPMLTAIKRLREPAPSPLSYVPGLDPRWAAVVLRCLERDPAARYPSVRDVAFALTASPAGGTAAVPPSGGAPTRIAAVVAVGIALVLGLGLAWWSRAAPRGAALAPSNVVAPRVEPPARVGASPPPPHAVPDRAGRDAPIEDAAPAPEAAAVRRSPDRKGPRRAPKQSQGDSVGIITDYPE